MATLGTAYVQIVPSAQGISGKISDVMNPEVNSAGKKAGISISNNIGGAFTKAAATGASAIAGMTGALTTKALSGGITRAVGLDDATAKFRQLGFDVDKAMGSVKDSVSGTRYSLDEAAGAAVKLGSAGVASGDDMTNALKSVASVASISGKDFNEIGSIYTKVAATGKVTGETMAQLMDNGVNANAALQQALGKSSDEISQMVSSGQIDFETFSTAMRDYFGDAAESANSTFSGASANVQSALGRMGAAFTSPALEALRVVFAGTGEESNGLIKAIDNVTGAMQPAIDTFSGFAETAGNKVAGALGTFNSVMEGGGSILDAFKAAVADLIPESIMSRIQGLDPGIQALLGKLGMGVGIIAGVAGGMGVLSGAVGSLVPGLGAIIGPLGGAGGAFKLISAAGSSLTGVIGKLIGGQGLGGLGSVLRTVMGPVGLIAAAFVVAYTQSESFRNAINQLVVIVGQAFMSIIQALIPVFQALMPVIQLAAGLFVRLATVAGNVLGPVLTALMPVIQRVVSVFVSVITIAARFVTAVLGIAKSITGLPSKIGSVFGKIKQHIAQKLNEAIHSVKLVVNKIKSFMSFSGLAGKVSSTFNSIKGKITKPIETARDTIKRIVNKIKGFFPLSVGKIFSNLRIPKINISGGKAPFGIGGKGKKPSISVSWNKKALENPYKFSNATLFGAGEAGDEVLYGHRSLMNDISEAVRSNSNEGDIVVNLNYDATDDANDMLRDLVRGVRRHRMAGAF